MAEATRSLSHSRNRWQFCIRKFRNRAFPVRSVKMDTEDNFVASTDVRGEALSAYPIADWLRSGGF